MMRAAVLGALTCSRCWLIAAVVGVVLCVVNGTLGLDASPAEIAIRTCGNFVVPFVVSNLGRMQGERQVRRLEGRVAQLEQQLQLERDQARSASQLGGVVADAADTSAAPSKAA